jgi:hypothetical protein
MSEPITPERAEDQLDQLLIRFSRETKSINTRLDTIAAVARSTGDTDTLAKIDRVREDLTDLLRQWRDAR